MKAFLAILTYTMLFAAQAAHVEDLTFECQGYWKVTEVGESKFNPAVPPKGRHNGFPSSGTVQVKLEVLNFKNVECSLLKSKYSADLDGPIQTTVYVSAPFDLKAVQWIAESLKDKVLPFQTHQSFNYVLNQNYLPLYPDIIEETLYLKSEDKKYSVTVPIEFSAQKVYGVIPVDNWDEEKQMKLAQQLSNLLDLHKAFSLNEFHDLYLKLDFKMPGNQRKHFLLTWKAFQEAAQAPFNHFFDFNTGGTGAFVGAPFAEKLTKLANQAASESEKAQLLYEFPTLLRANMFFQHECLNVDSGGFHQVLTKWYEQFDGFLSGKQHDVQEMMEGFVKPKTHLTNKCLLPLQTPENLQLAEKILQLK